MHPMFKVGMIAIAVLFTHSIIGCDQPEVPYLETKRIDERLEEAELSRFITVLKAVGAAERRQLMSPLLPAPTWSDHRSLPVRELVATEKEEIERQWSPEFHAEKLSRSETWARAISDVGWTRKQFCGLFLSVSAAVSRQ